MAAGTALALQARVEWKNEEQESSRKEKQLRGP